LKIAFCSPLPPARSGIASYSVRLLKYLVREHTLDCYYDNPPPDQALVPAEVRLFHFHRFPYLVQKENYDSVIYQMGNSIHHAFIYLLLHYYPGVIDLHDVNLHHLTAHIHSLDPIDTNYARIMKLLYGSAGAKLGHMSKAGIFSECQSFLFPLIAHLLENACGVIVHNKYATQRLQTLPHHYPLKTILPPIDPPPELAENTRAQLKLKLGFQSDDYMVCSFGEILRKKGCFEIVSAFCGIEAQFPHAKLIFVGALPDMREFSELLNDCACGNRIMLTGYVDDEMYQSYLSVCDLGINLRFPSVGETSQTLLELMAWGKPVIVSKADACLEIDSDCVYHLPVDQSLTAELSATLRFLLKNPTAGRETGRRARQYIRNKHSIQQTIKQYNKFITDESTSPRDAARLSTSLPFEQSMLQSYSNIIGQKLSQSGWSQSHESLVEEITTPIPWR